MSVPEIRRRLGRLVLAVEQPAQPLRAWSRWRRWHQQLAQDYHDKRRGALLGLVAASACTYHCSIKVDESALDEMWSLVKRKQQRWLWHVGDQQHGIVLAYKCGTHEDEVF